MLPKPATGFGPLTRTTLHIPGAHTLYRHALEYSADTILAPIMRRGWTAPAAEWVARRHLRHHIPDPELRAALTPDYPIGGKRILLDNHYYRTLTRDNVDLVTDKITTLTATGLATADGTHHRADIIIYATGFRASEFLAPIDIRGRTGTRLHDQWADGATAWHGLAVPGYPNMFLLAGPNTFTPAGSNPQMKEAQIDYIIDCLRWRDHIGAAAIEVTDHAMHTHQRWLEHALASTVWPAVHRNWYRHPSGRITNPWPGTVRQFRQRLCHHPAESFAQSPSSLGAIPRSLGGYQ